MYYINFSALILSDFIEYSDDSWENYMCQDLMFFVGCYHTEPAPLCLLLQPPFAKQARLQASYAHASCNKIGTNAFVKQLW
jgi:hypothetical protein